MLQRVQKIISAAGIASRRKAEVLIDEGRVTVNNKKIKLGDKADPDKDIVKLDGKKIFLENKVYIKLYKPYGYITTTKDRFAKKKVTDLVKTKEKIYPVGRLDKDTEGVLLLTNDGDFANKIMHPRYEIEKTYIAILNKRIRNEDIAKLEQGIKLEDGMSSPAILKVVDKTGKTVQIKIHEGRNRIIKRMFKAVGYFVAELKRTRIGDINLKDLKRGEFKHLTNRELTGIRKLIRTS